MKKEQAIFAAVFCSLLVIVMGSVLIVAADGEGAVNPILLWISQQVVALFTYPFAVISKLLNAPVRSAIIMYLLDIAVYSYLITLGITKWLNKRQFSIH